MQIIIDIPEELACEGFERPFTEDEKNILIKAIGNGTPLPKGHGRIGDLDAISLSDISFFSINDYCKMVDKLIDPSATIIKADKNHKRRK